MSDRQLLRQLACHFAIGASLGPLGLVSLLAIGNGLSDLVLGGANPVVTITILLAGASLCFGFNAAITGFCFAMVEGEKPGLKRL